MIQTSRRAMMDERVSPDGWWWRMRDGHFVTSFLLSTGNRTIQPACFQVCKSGRNIIMMSPEDNVASSIFVVIYEGADM